jgi:hypothetical protein
MEPAGGVYDKDASMVLAFGRETASNTTALIRPSLCLITGMPARSSPDRELFRCCSTERVSGGQHHFFP